MHDSFTMGSLDTSDTPDTPDTLSPLTTSLHTSDNDDASSEARSSPIVLHTRRPPEFIPTRCCCGEGAFIMRRSAITRWEAERGKFYMKLDKIKQDAKWETDLLAHRLDALEGWASYRSRFSEKRIRLTCSIVLSATLINLVLLFIKTFLY